MNAHHMCMCLSVSVCFQDFFAFYVPSLKMKTFRRRLSGFLPFFDTYPYSLSGKSR